MFAQENLDYEEFEKLKAIKEGKDFVKRSDVGSRPKIETLQDLTKALHEIFNDNRVNVEEVKEALEEYKSNAKDWKQFVKFDLFRYTRNLVDAGNGKFNLIILCWGENQASNIHDHSNSDCFVKILDGQLTETMYEWPASGNHENEDMSPNSMKAVKSTVNSKNDVTYINDSMGLHQMHNPSHSNKTVTLHLYSPPFKSCKVFDQQNGKSIDVKMTFWSKFDKDGKQVELKNADKQK